MIARGIVELHKRRGNIQPYWYRLKSPNGKVLVVSENFASRLHAERMIAKYFPFPEWKFKDETGE